MSQALGTRPGLFHRAHRLHLTMVLTRYGVREWLSATAVAALAATVLLWLGWWGGLIGVGAGWLSVLWFFRDPIRRIRPSDDSGIMRCPADGKISAIETVEHHEAVGGPATVIRVFLSVLDVHINRSPAAGEVVSVCYAPGAFRDARTPESATENESNLIVLKLDDGQTIGVRQIAGKIARRIVCRLEVGDRVEAGQRFGMIKFGSSAELILPRPDDVVACVSVGDKVKGGLTQLATFGPATTRTAVDASMPAATLSQHVAPND